MCIGVDALNWVECILAQYLKSLVLNQLLYSVHDENVTLFIEVTNVTCR